MKTLVAAKVPVGFALDAPTHHPDGLRLSAALAIAAGADEVSAWKALTSDAARLANVADRVGSLEEGKDADFVLKTGGVASGIDGALGIVAKTKGEESARRAARAIEYESWLAQAGGQK